MKRIGSGNYFSPLLEAEAHTGALSALPGSRSGQTTAGGCTWLTGAHVRSRRAPWGATLACKLKLQRRRQLNFSSEARAPDPKDSSIDEKLAARLLQAKRIIRAPRFYTLHWAARQQNKQAPHANALPLAPPDAQQKLSRPGASESRININFISNPKSSTSLSSPLFVPIQFRPAIISWPADARRQRHDEEAALRFSQFIHLFIRLSKYQL